MNAPKETVAYLVAGYVSAAEAHAAASLVGDDDSVNRAAVELAHHYRNLRAFGREGEERLLQLLEHPSAGVRVWAGAHCLEFEPVRAEQTLQVLAAQPGAAALDARMTLREWRRGTLRFP